MTYNSLSIADIVKGHLLSGSGKNSIRFLLIDSRKVHAAEESLFFALEGQRHNGHKFIPELYKKGVRNFIISEKNFDYNQFPDACFILVENTLEALQKLASAHREKFSIPVIGITGSNGKTIVKEWLFQLLREDKSIVRSPKSYNSQVGVPVSVWQINKDHNLGIFEAGISLPGEMQKLSEIIQPTTGIFTNIGQAHSENFNSSEQKVAEKLLLFKDSKSLVYCRDYAVIHEHIQKNPDFDSKKIFSWSRKTKADLLITKITQGPNECEIQGIYNNDFLKIRIPFSDEASIENAIHCWSFMLMSGYDNKIISDRMLLLSPVAMRLELKEGINNCSIINDSYNSDLGSLSIALDFLNQQKQHPKRTLILSDILQSGKSNEALYTEVAQLLNKKGIDRLIGIGDAIQEQAGQFNLDKKFYSNTEEFLEHYSPTQFNNETILLKGARTFHFEEISKLLQQKAHETVLEINLNAFINNVNYYRSKLKPETKIMAMVKAFSYGSGSFEIANVLQFHHADYLAVAYADEGVELRKAGINLPIMVMNPEEPSYEAMIKYGLEPEIFSFRILNLFLDTARRIQPKKPVPVHIKIDTGMHRLGFVKDELNELLVRVKNSKYITVKSVFSHLVGSDDKQFDEFTNKQIEEFKEISDSIVSYLQYPVLSHILNSAGIARFPEAQFDMVRLGIGMYGISTDEYEQMQLQNVSTLKSTISQIRNVGEGDTIGYSRKGILSRNSRIATVPIGYADGLSRRLGNGKGKMYVNGKFAPTVGNVCMDMVMLDVTDISVIEGDDVIIFGDELPIAELAEDLETIPYEILTMVSRRVKRVYYHE